MQVSLESPVKSLFGWGWNKVVGHHACKFIKKRLQQRCFPVSIAKFLITPVLKNKLDLLWVPSFMALGISFIFGTKFPWNACFNVECVLSGCNFDFLGGRLVVTTCYLLVNARYYSLSGDFCLLLVVTAYYRSLLLIPTFSMNGLFWYISNMYIHSDSTLFRVCHLAVYLAWCI